MLKPSADLKIDASVSRYALVVAVAKRARELTSEMENSGQIYQEKPVDLAVREFMTYPYKLVVCTNEDSASTDDLQ